MKKITLASLLLLCLSSNTHAQFSSVWTAAYQHTTSPGYSNEGRKVAEDPSGNNFILSDNTSDIDPNGVQGATTYHYVTVAKYNSTGALVNSLVLEVYDHATSGFNIPGAFGLEVDAAGDVYVGYTTWDAITGFDIVLEKFDNDLYGIWSNFYVTNGNEEGIDFKIDQTGTICAIVKSTDAQANYSVIKSVPFNLPAVLVYAFPPTIIVLNTLDIDGNQTAYVGGYIFRSGYADAYIGAIDISNDVYLWGTLYTPKGFSGDDMVTDITVGVDGNIYSTGLSIQGSNLVYCFVTKNTPGDPKFEFVNLVKVSAPRTAGILIDASITGWVYIGAVSLDDPNAFVIRIPDDGNYSVPGVIKYVPEPGVQFNYVNTISLNDMKVSASGNVYITGGISATGLSGDFNCSYLYKTRVVFGNALINDGGMTVDGDAGNNYEGFGMALDYSKTDVFWLRNYWDGNHNNESAQLIDINVPSSLREAFQWSKHENISIYPNPASTTAEVAFTEIINDIEVFDITGNRVKYIQAGSVMTKLDVTSLATGYYVVKANTVSGQLTKPLIINR
jgi:hypothetical protein